MSSKVWVLRFMKTRLTVFLKEAQLCSRNAFGFLIASWFIFSVFARMDSTVFNTLFSELAEKQGERLKCPHWTRSFQRRNCFSITTFPLSFLRQELQNLPRSSSLNNPTQHRLVPNLLFMKTWPSFKIDPQVKEPTLSSSQESNCFQSECN